MVAIPIFLPTFEEQTTRDMNELLKEIATEFDYFNNEDYYFNSTIENKEYEVMCTVNDGTALFISVFANNEDVDMPKVKELVTKLVFQGWLEHVANLEAEETDENLADKEAEYKRSKI